MTVIYITRLLVNVLPSNLPALYILRRLSFIFRKLLSYHWLAHGVMAAICIVQLTVSEVHSRTTCDFYPLHGVIQNWYYESYFHQPPNNGHGTNIFGKRSFIYVRNCQYTGSYKNYGGKHLILVFCPVSKFLSFLCDILFTTSNTILCLQISSNHQ